MAILNLISQFTYIRLLWFLKIGTDISYAYSYSLLTSLIDFLRGQRLIEQKTFKHFYLLNAKHFIILTSLHWHFARRAHHVTLVQNSHAYRMLRRPCLVDSAIGFPASYFGLSGSGSGSQISLEGFGRVVWWTRTFEKYPSSGLSCPRLSNTHLSNAAWVARHLDKSNILVSFNHSDLIVIPLIIIDNTLFKLQRYS